MRLRSFRGLAALLLVAAGNTAFAQSPYAYPVTGAYAPYAQVARSNGNPGIGYPAAPYAESLSPTPAPAPVSPYQQAMEPQGSGLAPYSVQGGPVNAGPAYDDASIGAAMPCGTSCMSNWRFYAGGLYLKRACEKDVNLSYDTANPWGDPVLSLNDASTDWMSGFEARIGRVFNCGQNAIEVAYWGLHPSDQSACVNSDNLAGNLSHTFTYNTLTYNAGQGFGDELVDAYYGNSRVHALCRGWQMNNLEVNLLGNPCGMVWGNCNNSDCGCGPCLTVGWLAGLRWLNIDEDLAFRSDDTDDVWDGDSNELTHHMDMTNNLLGFQLGTNIEYCLCQHVSLTAAVKGGVFGNQIDYNTCLYGSNGTAWVGHPTSPWTGQTYNISSSETELAFLGELQLGANVRLSKCWSANFAYRMIGISGVGSLNEQFPSAYDDFTNAEKIQSCGGLVLHGFSAGVELNW